MIIYNLNSIFIENIVLLSILLLSILVIIATVYDLKFKIIPNKITISLISWGLIINTINSIISNNYFIIVNSVILTIVVFLIGYLLWRLKVWGGGDVKLITGISSILPFHPNVLNQYLDVNNDIFDFSHISFINSFMENINIVDFPVMNFYPFPFTIILNSILISFPFLIAVVTFNYIKMTFYNNFYNNNNNNNNNNKNNNNNNNNNNYNIFNNIFNKKYTMDDIKNYTINNIKNYIKNIKNPINKLYKNKYIIINYITFNFKKKTVLLAISFICLFIFRDYGLYSINNFNSIFSFLFYGFILTFLSPIFIILIKKFRNISKKGSRKLIPLSELKEGIIIDDIIIKKIFLEDNKNINEYSKEENKFNKNKINLDLILKKLNFKKKEEKYNLYLKKEKKHHVFKIKSAAGLNANDIYLLNELSNNKLISSFIEVKLGIPFVPSIAIGLILSIFIGDLIIFGIKLINQLI